MAANSATSVVSLDFTTIKNNLVNYLKSNSNIKDYDYEGSNINTVLDVLSYNTYLNNFYINMLANEMFLDTAQIKDSIISHAKELNYVPRSVQSSKAIVNVKVIPTNSPGSITLNKWTKFSTTIDGVTKTFSTHDDTIIRPSTNTTGGVEYIASNVELYEGLIVEEFFAVDTANNFIAEITNNNVDTRHLTVTVRASNTSSVRTLWSKADTLFGLGATSNSYFLEPAKDDKFRITFGDGVFGKKPSVGNIIEIKYRSATGANGNNGKVFTSSESIGGYSNVIVTTVANSAGGAAAESVDDIKFNAPRAFQVQERAVTANDYKILAQKEYPNIQNVLAFGGEELSPPKFGKVVLAVDLIDSDGVPETLKSSLSSFFKKRTPVGIDVEVITPEFVYLEVTGKVSYNISLTTQAIPSIRTKSINALTAWADNNINGFDVVYRNSKATAAVDAADNSIISSQLENRIFKKFTPSSSLAASYNIEFNNALKADDIFSNTTSKNLYKPAVESSQFTYSSATNAFLIDDGVGKLRIVRLDNQNNFVTLLTDAGTVNYTTGLVEINSLLIPSFVGGTFNVYARVDNDDIKTKKQSILQLNAENITIDVLQERI
jgi:hypothetical protein